jgi:hypothetical protein
MGPLEELFQVRLIHTAPRISLSIGQPGVKRDPPADDIRAGRGYNPDLMKYFYGEYDGEEFPTQDKLFGFDQMMDFIMEHGEQALKALEQMLKDPKKPEHSELLEQLIKEGLLDKVGIASRERSRTSTATPSPSWTCTRRCTTR